MSAPAPGLYAYGHGRRSLRPVAADPGQSPQERPQGLPGRVLAALEALGGEALTPEIRAKAEADGGPAFHPGYLSETLSKLARLDPPLVIMTGRENVGKGRAGRWRLGRGAPGRIAAGGGERS